MKCCEYGHWDRILNASFSLKLTNVPNKVECYLLAFLTLRILAF
jgi:hypothetical protein